MGTCYTSEIPRFRIISPVLYAAWIAIGLAPMEREIRYDTFRVRLMLCQGRKSVLRSTIWLLITALLIAMLSYINDNWNFREWDLALVAYMFQKWMGRTSLLLTYWICATTGLRHLRSFIRALRFADHCLSENDVQYWKKALGNIVLVIYCVIMSSILVSAQKRYREIYSRLILIVVVFFKTLVTLQFVFLVLELRERFRSVNASLRELLPPLSVPELRAVFGEDFWGVSPRAASGRLRQLREAYVVLTHAAETLQQHCGPPLALNIACCVGAATFYAYGMLSSAGRQLSPYQWAGTTALWLANHSFRLVAMSLACAAAADAAADTGPLLLRASAVCDWRDPELDAFMQLTLRGPPLCFTAAGLVVVDRRLLVSALAVVVSYLVVLGQQ
ncbi:uncharacterized protein LOC126335510 [Schistocerca gregaria]|uniref:uncharacterized protein LOC126335510 n=1 Tax=Schistocerca gregaria TaxID=7010 RepID=UPI00211E491E|nr:uncharacterized protein LOC126335510 [Schistocerca gregaria]